MTNILRRLMILSWVCWAGLARAAVDWHACIVQDKSLVPAPIAGAQLGVFDQKNCVMLPDINSADSAKPGAGEDDMIALWATDRASSNIVTLAEGAGHFYFEPLGSERIELTQANALPTIQETSRHLLVYLKTEKIVDSGGNKILQTLAHGTPIKLTVARTVSDSTSTSASQFPFGFIWRHQAVPYGIAKSETLFWLPVGLFSTTFQSTADGIPFAALPVGGALGLKLYVSRDIYLGASVMGNWLVSPGKDAQGKPDNTYNLAGLTTGILFDLNNYIYLGYAYGFDLRSGGKHPGSMFVFGLGPGLLQLIQSKNYSI